MSERAIWKMLHLLNRSAKGKISRAALEKAGIDCYMDTIEFLLQCGAVIKDPPYVPGQVSDDPGDLFWLSPSAQYVFNQCLVGNKRLGGKDMIVDFPRAFVIMPFRNKLLSKVYNRMIKPAVKAAKLACVRGDTSPRVAELNTDIWNDILEAGIVIAEVSEPNPNVYYELGLVHAIGKPAFLLVQKGRRAPMDLGTRYNYRRDFSQANPLPSDFGGAHYYDYDPGNLEEESRRLVKVLKKWAVEYRSAYVKAVLR